MLFSEVGLCSLELQATSFITPKKVLNILCGDITEECNVVFNSEELIGTTE
jgi:hypothetical protein